VEHLVYASSSNVYGSNKKVPYSTDDKVDNPVSLYAATKKSNELLAHAYSKLYNIPFVDDIVWGVVRVMQHAPEASPKSSPEGKDLGIHTAAPMMYEVLKRRAEEMRKNPTEAESVLWNALKANRLGVKFRQQHIIEYFIVDFYCNEYKVTIEVDGKYHDTFTQTKSDNERTTRLIELGYTELRFTNKKILHDLDSVLKKIKTFCSGTPFPSGEGWGEAVPYKVYNIGNSSPENLLDFVTILQEELIAAKVLSADYDF